MNKEKILNLIIPSSVFVIAGIYYYLLSAKILTWIYTSGDAGDWLVQLRWWMTPHTFGKPVYIGMVHLASYLPFGDDIFKITIISVLAGAISVMMTYLIALHWTNSKIKSLTAATVLLGAIMFTSQTAVIEQYTVMAMFFSLFFYFYIKEKKVLSMVCLGLLTATHAIGFVFFVLFLIFRIIKYKEYKEWARPAIVYILVGFLPYTLTLASMSFAEQNIIAGKFSAMSVLEYMGSNSTSSSALALVSLPERLFEATRIIVISLGIAIIPMIKSKGEIDKKTGLVLLAITGFCFWFYLTNWFGSLWKYIAVILPVLSGLVALGLKKMKPWHTYAIIGCALLLVVINGIYANPNKLAHAEPLATNYTTFLQELPDGTGIITPRGGAYGFALFYEISKGKELIPFALTLEMDTSNSPAMQSYLSWVKEEYKEYDVQGDNYYELTLNHINNGHEVYFANMTPTWKEIFTNELDLEIELVDNPNEIYRIRIK